MSRSNLLYNNVKKSYVFFQVISVNLFQNYSCIDVLFFFVTFLFLCHLKMYVLSMYSVALNANVSSCNIRYKMDLLMQNK